MGFDPPVSCVCITHGRAHVIGEAIESYVRQDYQGASELLILNDCPEQPLEVDVPGVRVVNTALMWQDVSVKFNDAVAMAEHDLVAWWEDDDISLPWRMSLSVDELRRHDVGAFKQHRAWYWDHGLRHIADNLFYGSVLFNRHYYDASTGATPGEPADRTAWLNMDRLGNALSVASSPRDSYFVYRWGGMGVSHDSGVAGTNADRFAAFRGRTIAKMDSLGLRGAQRVVPRWREDYTSLVQAHEDWARNLAGHLGEY